MFSIKSIAIVISFILVILIGLDLTNKKSNDNDSDIHVDIGDYCVFGCLNRGKESCSSAGCAEEFSLIVHHYQSCTAKTPKEPIEDT